MSEHELLQMIIYMAIMTVFFLFGGCVQRACKFIWFHDIFTISLMIFVSADVSVSALTPDYDITPWAIYYYVPAVVAYFVGYLVSSRREYFYLTTPQLSLQRQHVGYIVPYEHGGRQCIQDQTNRALVKRLLFGVEHIIDSNAALQANWEITVDHPYLPIPKVDAMIVSEIVALPPEIVRKDKWIKCRQYTTRITVAPASMHNKIELMMIENAHNMDVNENIKLVRELTKAKDISYRNSLYVAADTINYALTDSKPGIQIIRHMEDGEAAKSKKTESDANRRIPKFRHREGGDD